MRSIRILAALFVTTTAASAQQATLDFKPFEFLLGSCWTGTFPDGKQTDEHCFEWMLDKKFIRDKHVVRNGPGPYSGETVYSIDAGTKQIVFAYYSSAGFVMKGSAVATADSIVFPSTIKTAQGETEMKSVWTKRGADGYHVTDMQRTPQGWKTTREMDFRRNR